MTNIHPTFLFQVLIVVLILIVTSLVTFFFLGVHLDGWAEGLAQLFIPEVYSLIDSMKLFTVAKSRLLLHLLAIAMCSYFQQCYELI